MRTFVIDCIRRRGSQRLCTRLLCLAFAFLLLLPASANALVVGDLDISVVPQPAVDGKPISKVGGYIEHRIRIQNRSAQKDYTVRLNQSGLSRHLHETHLDQNSRTVQVAKGATVVVSLFQPVMSQWPDSLDVIIDGTNSGANITFSVPFGPNYSSSNQATAVLCGRGISQEYRDEVRAQFPEKVGFCRSELPVSEWSPNWLGYTAYDVVLLTEQEAKSLPEDVQTGLQRYVETGGILQIVGSANEKDLVRAIPAGMLAASTKQQNGIVYLGFGEIRLQQLLPDYERMFALWSEAPKRVSFPEESVRYYTESQTPIRGLSVLMIAFAIGIGPLNIWLLSRKGKKMWLWWNVPLISFLTCLTVFSYSILAEGIRGDGKTTVLTLLDENIHRATTIGYASFYSPISTADGLHFSYDTDVFLLEEEEDHIYRRGGWGGRRSGRATRVDWTKDQHLTSGWILPRAPADFALRKNETRRERMVFRKGEDGTITAVNGLGVDVEQLKYMDFDGQYYVGKDIAAGQEARLEKQELGEEEKEHVSLRKFYLQDWAQSFQRIRSTSKECLMPGTYLAFTWRSPFLEVSYPAAKEMTSSGIIFGICAKGDGNGR